MIATKKPSPDTTLEDKLRCARRQLARAKRDRKRSKESVRVAGELVRVLKVQLDKSTSPSRDIF